MAKKRKSTPEMSETSKDTVEQSDALENSDTTISKKHKKHKKIKKRDEEENVDTQHEANVKDQQSVAEEADGEKRKKKNHKKRKSDIDQVDSSQCREPDLNSNGPTKQVSVETELPDTKRKKKKKKERKASSSECCLKSHDSDLHSDPKKQKEETPSNETGLQKVKKKKKNKNELAKVESVHLRSEDSHFESELKNSHVKLKYDQPLQPDDPQTVKSKKRKKKNKKVDDEMDKTENQETAKSVGTISSNDKKEKQPETIQDTAGSKQTSLKKHKSKDCEQEAYDDRPEKKRKKDKSLCKTENDIPAQETSVKKVKKKNKRLSDEPATAGAKLSPEKTKSENDNQEENNVCLTNKTEPVGKITSDQSNNKGSDNSDLLVPGQWKGNLFESSERQSKFLRLMGGMKREIPSQGGEKKGLYGSLALVANKKESSGQIALSTSAVAELNQKLEDEYNKALNLKLSAKRGTGFGFTPDPAEGKILHIDINKTNSIKFDN